MNIYQKSILLMILSSARIYEKFEKETRGEIDKLIETMDKYLDKFQK